MVHGPLYHFFETEVEDNIFASEGRKYMKCILANPDHPRAPRLLGLSGYLQMNTFLIFWTNVV